MELAESFVDLFEERNLSGVRVFCEQNNRHNYAEEFMKVFSEKWNEAQNKADEEYSNCVKISAPASVSITDYGFLISVSPLEIRYCYGDFYIPDIGNEAFYYSLTDLKEAHPDIEYDGYIAYILSDRRYGEAWQWEISSKPYDLDEPCDYVGEKLKEILSEDYYVPEEPLGVEGVIFAITGKLEYFENRDEIKKYVEKLGGRVIDNISSKTNYLISNEMNLKPSEQKIAEKYHIPVISEYEFITLFCNPEKFKLDVTESTCNWGSLYYKLMNNLDYEDSIETLYAYSEWISKPILDRAVRSIIFAAVQDEDYINEYCLEENVEEENAKENVKDKLTTLVKRLEKKYLTGNNCQDDLNENPDADDDECDLQSELPKGMSEAMDVVILAEMMGYEDPLEESVQGSVDFLIEKAKEGDIEAKCTVARYYIANDENVELGKQWLQEAIEAGYEEGQDDE